jgi:hypothetical protein
VAVPTLDVFKVAVALPPTTGLSAVNVPLSTQVPIVETNTMVEEE